MIMSVSRGSILKVGLQLLIAIISWGFPSAALKVSHIVEEGSVAAKPNTAGGSLIESVVDEERSPVHGKSFLQKSKSNRDAKEKTDPCSGNDCHNDEVKKRTCSGGVCNVRKDQPEKTKATPDFISSRTQSSKSQSFSRKTYDSSSKTKSLNHLRSTSRLNDIDDAVHHYEDHDGTDAEHHDDEIADGKDDDQGDADHDDDKTNEKHDHDSDSKSDSDSNIDLSSEDGESNHSNDEENMGSQGNGTYANAFKSGLGKLDYEIEKFATISAEKVNKGVGQNLIGRNITSPQALKTTYEIGGVSILSGAMYELYRFLFKSESSIQPAYSVVSQLDLRGVAQVYSLIEGNCNRQVAYWLAWGIQDEEQVDPVSEVDGPRTRTSRVFKVNYNPQKKSEDQRIAVSSVSSNGEPHIPSNGLPHIDKHDRAAILKDVIFGEEKSQSSERTPWKPQTYETWTSQDSGALLFKELPDALKTKMLEKVRETVKKRLAMMIKELVSSARSAPHEDDPSWEKILSSVGESANDQELLNLAEGLSVEQANAVCDAETARHGKDEAAKADVEWVKSNISTKELPSQKETPSDLDASLDLLKTPLVIHSANHGGDDENKKKRHYRDKVMNYLTETILFDDEYVEQITKNIIVNPLDENFVAKGSEASKTVPEARDPEANHFVLHSNEQLSRYAGAQQGVQQGTQHGTQQGPESTYYFICINGFKNPYVEVHGLLILYRSSAPKNQQWVSMSTRWPPASYGDLERLWGITDARVGSPDVAFALERRTAKLKGITIQKRLKAQLRKQNADPSLPGIDDIPLHEKKFRIIAAGHLYQHQRDRILGVFFPNTFGRDPALSKKGDSSTATIASPEYSLSMVPTSGEDFYGNKYMDAMVLELQETSTDDELASSKLMQTIKEVADKNVVDKYTNALKENSKEFKPKPREARTFHQLRTQIADNMNLFLQKEYEKRDKTIQNSHNSQISIENPMLLSQQKIQDFFHFTSFEHIKSNTICEVDKKRYEAKRAFKQNQSQKTHKAVPSGKINPPEVPCRIKPAMQYAANPILWWGFWQYEPLVDSNCVAVHYSGDIKNGQLKRADEEISCLDNPSASASPKGCYETLCVYAAPDKYNPFLKALHQVFGESYDLLERVLAQKPLLIHQELQDQYLHADDVAFPYKETLLEKYKAAFLPSAP